VASAAQRRTRFHQAPQASSSDVAAIGADRGLLHADDVRTEGAKSARGERDAGLQLLVVGEALRGHAAVAEVEADDAERRGQGGRRGEEQDERETADDDGVCARLRAGDQGAWPFCARPCYRPRGGEASEPRTTSVWGDGGLARLAMNARLATALVAVSFALAMCQPRLGIVVHRHAGSGRTHVHVGEAGEHAHEVAVAVHDHEHEVARIADREDAPRGRELRQQHHDHPAAGSPHHHGPDAHLQTGTRHRQHDHAHDGDERDVGAIPAVHDHPGARAEVTVRHRTHPGSAPLTDAEHHNELAALRVDPPPPPPDDASLVTGSSAHAWHTHTSHPFHHAALPVPPIVAAPVAVARLVLLPPHHRGDLAPIPGRSRAPPSVQSS